MHKNLFLLLCLVTLSAFGYAQSPEQLDIDYGFAGYRLESRKDSVRSLVKNGKQDHLVIYRPANLDSMYFKGIKLKQMKLFYFQGHLHSIDVKTDEKNSPKLLVALQRMYGDGEQMDIFGNEIAWYGENTRLTYEKNPVMGNAIFSFTSKKMHVKYVTYMYDITHGERSGN